MKSCLRIVLALAVALAAVCLVAVFFQKLTGARPEKEYISIDLD